jgi:hypothetical protein
MTRSVPAGRGQMQTQFSQFASSAADVFRAAFVKTKLGASSLDLTEPEVSTNGGRRALQHIRLKHPSGLALVVGHVDLGTQRAGMRSYAWVSKAFPARFGGPCDFAEQDYAMFQKQAKDVLFALSVEMETLPDVEPGNAPGELGGARAAPKRRALVAVAVVLIVAAALATVAAMKLHLLR